MLLYGLTIVRNIAVWTNNKANVILWTNKVLRMFMYDIAILGMLLNRIIKSWECLCMTSNIGECYSMG